MAETSVSVVKRYLEDAIAAEKGFEAQYESFARETEDPSLQDLFRHCAAETKSQHERLTGQLSHFGGSPSTTKGLLAQLFGLSPKIAQLGQEEPERTAQNLLIAFAVENSKLALYEALATVADAAGEEETAALARSIQSQDRVSAERIWRLLPGTPGESFSQSTEGDAKGVHSAG